MDSRETVVTVIIDGAVDGVTQMDTLLGHAVKSVETTVRNAPRQWYLAQILPHVSSDTYAARHLVVVGDDVIIGVVLYLPGDQIHVLGTWVAPVHTSPPLYLNRPGSNRDSLCQQVYETWRVRHSGPQ